MRSRQVAVILATGGMGLVRAAYSAGKPAYGVGPGNAPAYIERSAEVRKAVRDIMIFLQSYGVTPSQAAKIYRTYGDEAMAKL